MKNRKVFILISLLCLLFLFSVFSGCGKKADPAPPEIKGEKIAAPFDLKYKLDQSTIILSWQHVINKETASIVPDRFEIFMAKKQINECQGCPFKFKHIESVDMPEMKFEFKLKKGFKYYFKVQATESDNLKSTYSKIVQAEL